MSVKHIVGFLLTLLMAFVFLMAPRSELLHFVPSGHLDLDNKIWTNRPPAPCRSQRGRSNVPSVFGPSLTSTASDNLHHIGLIIQNMGSAGADVRHGNNNYVCLVAVMHVSKPN